MICENKKPSLFNDSTKFHSTALIWYQINTWFMYWDIQLWQQITILIAIFIQRTWKNKILWIYFIDFYFIFTNEESFYLEIYFLVLKWIMI